MLTLTLTRILIVLSFTLTLRGSAPSPTPAATAGPLTAHARVARLVDDTEGCRAQPAARPIAPAACE